MALDRFYGNLRNYIKMTVDGYTNLLMLDAKGGLGKTHNVVETLREECEDNEWYHKKGFTTPLELYKTLWTARGSNTVLFLDDMSGVSSNTKAIDMLKAATDTQGEENRVSYQTSRDIKHPFADGRYLPGTFTFRGTIIMSFNDTPDNSHFRALTDRGTYYKFSLTYRERIDLIREIAELEDFSDLSVEEQVDTAEWIARVTDSSYDVTIRSLDEICKMRLFAKENGSVNWTDMALEVFDINHAKYRIIELREADEMPVSEQVSTWCDEFDKSESSYYDLFDEVRDARSQ
jgi:hypothetical protein